MAEHSPRQRPEWVTQEDEAHHPGAFTSHVMKGVDDASNDRQAPQGTGGVFRSQRKQRRRLSPEEIIAGVRAGERGILARAITLIESNSPRHRETARAVLQELLPATGKSIRIGITGVPGVGKSTFIETFGKQLCKQGHRVAVLAVDPTSNVSGGSILGDKTRMEELVHEPNAFVRPSPSGGTLGGVARKSRETILCCEAAGFDVIIVETVGVGQNEVTVRSMVDFFLLLQLAGAGDELQGIKKGVIEIADAIVVNKADGDNKPRAERARGEYARVLHYLQNATEGWETPARTCSAYTGEGIAETWDLIEQFREQTQRSGVFEERRKRQAVNWMHALIEEALKTRFYQDPDRKRELNEMEARVAAGKITPAAAVEAMLGE